MLVVSNTTPLNYLVLIEAEAILPQLFERLLVPPAVIAELSRAATPWRVRDWLARRPAWLDIAAEPITTDDPSLAPLDEGEREAIALAAARGAGLLLMDERDGVRIARSRGLTVVGTLGVLDRGAELGIVELPVALARLQATTFRASPGLFAALIDRDAARRARRSEPGE